MRRGRRIAVLLAGGLAVCSALTTVASADFASCLGELRVQALAAGVTPATFDAYAAGLQPNDVTQFVGVQPEFTTPIWDYLAGFVDEERVRDGREMMRRYGEALSTAEARYGVDKAVVAAVWGVESDFGRGVGRRPVLTSLATLACSGIARQAYFRGEFLAALRIVQGGHVRPEHFLGSWAGAFGQTQFMPTTFERFAVDLDGDGRRDLVDSAADAIGSTANYLRGHGWVTGLDWGFEVKLPPQYRGPSGRSAKATMAAWASRGLTRLDGEPLNGPGGATRAALLLPAGPDGPALLVTANFDVIFSYNAAESYALAISLLADRLRGLSGLATPWPNGLRGLSRAERRELQSLLLGKGYNIGEPDGVLGGKTRAAIQDFQTRAGLPADGQASGLLLDAVRAAAP